MKRFIEACLPWFFYGLGFLFFGLAGYFYFTAGPALALETPQTELEVSDGVAGQKQDVVLHLHNHSREGIRILGLTTC